MSMRSATSTRTSTPDSGSATLPVHRALFIPELLDIIFNFLDKNSNITNACVCKRWSNIALNVVWKEVDDFLYLFRLLKPICRQKGRYCFETFPEASDWARFEKYASRVRSFKFTPDKYHLEIYPLLDDVARTRTSLEILPNMHTLQWIHISPIYMEYRKIFLHRHLRHLSIAAPSQLHLRSDFFTDLCARAPHLRSLTLYITYPGKPIDAELSIVLQNLPELRKIVFPEFHYTSAVIEKLSRAKNICVLDFSHDSELGYGDPVNVASFAPALEEGAFPCLRELNLSAGIDDLDRFFRSKFAPTHITTLYVNSYMDHTPTELHTFLTTLSQECRLLSTLNLQLYHRVVSIDLPADRQLSYDTIKPILAFPNLTSFELVHKYPLRIMLNELEDLASNWPNLEGLVLNAEPLFLDEAAFTLDLRAFLPFARHCPRLRVLGLYINATEAEIPPSHIPLEPFSDSLQTIFLGTSQVSDASAVAMFLSRICSSGCSLELGISWTEFGCKNARFLPRDLRHACRERCLGWQDVEDLLPALIRLRREEEARWCALQEEVEDLRVRGRLLMDKIGVTEARDTCIIT